MAKKKESAEKTNESAISESVEYRGDEAAQGAEVETNESTSSPEAQKSALSVEEGKAALDRYLRLAAEFENYKKRVQKDQAEYTKYANERILKDLLPVLDNLQRALQHAQQSDGSNGLLQGVELTCKQYLETLSRFGVKPIPSVGLPFDPAVHQAVATVESEKHEPNMIVKEHEKGYYLHDRVLRPAMVTVVAATKAEDHGDAEPASQ